MMRATIYSIPRSEAEAARWPATTDACPRCGEVFDSYKKMLRLDDGAVIHTSCATEKELP